MQPPTQLPKGKPPLQTNRNWYKSLQTALPLPMRLSNGKSALKPRDYPMAPSFRTGLPITPTKIPKILLTSK